MRPRARRSAARALALCALCACGGSPSSPARPELPENASKAEGVASRAPAVGYLAAGTVGLDPESGSVRFTGNPLAVAWVDGALRPADLEPAVAAFRDVRVVSGLDRGGRRITVDIAPGDPPSEGMFTMRLGGTVENAGGPEIRSVLLAVPGVSMVAVPQIAEPVPEATAADHERRVRAALRVKPPYDECGDNTYDMVEKVAVTAGARLGQGGALAATYKVTVNTRARSSNGEPLSALFLGTASSVEPPYLGICRDHPAWRADPELAVRFDDRATFLLVVTACGCEEEDRQLLSPGTGE